MTANVSLDRYVEKWWLLFGVALFLMIPFDLLTTLIAVTKYGIGVEANPIMRWLLSQGLLAVAVVNLLVLLVVVYLFHIAIGGVRRAAPSNRRSLIHIVNTWIGILLLVGVLVIVNNFLVLV